MVNSLVESGGLILSNSSHHVNAVYTNNKTYNVTSSIYYNNAYSIIWTIRNTM